MNAKHFLTIIVCCALLFDCDSDDQVDYPDLHIYIERFSEEARARGWNIDHSIVEAEYTDIINVDSHIYCGYGWSDYYGTGKRRIEISKTCQWADLSDDDREILVFHELGHALLNRPHDSRMDCKGEQISIMNEIPPHYKSSDIEKRTYYIDELFDQLTARDKCINYGKDFTIDPQFYKYVSTDNNWIFYSSNGRYTGTQTQSPVISCSDNSTTETGYWFRQFESPAIPHCTDLTLRVKMNSTGLMGDGAAIAVRVYENEILNAGAITKQTQFFTTEGNPASGVLTDYVQELVVPCVSMKTTYMIIFGVMMPGTTGQVSFDDIQLLVKE